MNNNRMRSFRLTDGRYPYRWQPRATALSLFAAAAVVLTLAVSAVATTTTSVIPKASWMQRAYSKLPAGSGVDTAVGASVGRSASTGHDLVYWFGASYSYEMVIGNRSMSIPNPHNIRGGYSGAFSAVVDDQAMLSYRNSKYYERPCVCEENSENGFTSPWARFDSAGWSQTQMSAAMDTTTQRLYSCGYFLGAETRFDPYNLTNTNINGTDGFVVSFNAADGSVDWLIGFGGSGWDEATSIDISHPYGVVFGEFTSSIMTIGPFSLTPNFTPKSVNVFWFPFNLNDGTVLAAVSGGGNGTDQANTISVDELGQSFLVGDTTSTDFYWPSNAVSPLFRTNGMKTGYLMKLTPAGAVMWSLSIQSCNASSSIGGVAVFNSSSLVIVNGHFSCATFVLGGYTTAYNPSANTDSPSSDIFVAAFSAVSGTFLWGLSGGGDTDDVSSKIEFDSAGYAYFAGSSTSSPFVFGNFSLTNVQNQLNPFVQCGTDQSTACQSDAIAAKFDPAGNLLFCIMGGGVGNEAAVRHIPSQTAGQSYLVGWTASYYNWIFPGMNIIPPNLGNSLDGFVMKIDSLNDCIGNTKCQNGGTCVDGANEVSCICPPAFDNGTPYCTALVPCASAPCMNGGTCYNMPDNTYQCGCVPMWGGNQCEVDINECAINNGGCGLFSQCTNLIGSRTCTVALEPGTVFTIPYATQHPLLLDTIRPGQLSFNLDAVGTPLSSLYATIANPDFPTVNAVPCDPVVASFGPPNQIIAFCTFPAFSAINYNLYIYAGGSGTLLTTVNDTISTPPPQMPPNSLRRVQAGYTNVSSTHVEMDTVAPSIIQFYCVACYLPAPGLGHTVVTYGPATNPSQYACTIINSLSDPFTITCLTAADSSGTDFRFTVTVGGRVAHGNDTISFPVIPFVTRVTGCTNSGNATVDCPTRGGNVITVFGLNFIQFAIRVLVNGLTCASPVVVTPSELTCTLSAGVGEKLPVIVNSRGQLSPSMPLLSYAAPLITAVTGCDPVAGRPEQTVNCWTAGNQALNISGTNFGDSGAIVLIGSSFCANVQQTSDSFISCNTVSGTGLDRPIFVIQAQGRIGVGTAALSYALCPAGTAVDPSNSLNCTTCMAGTYTNAPGLALCLRCLPSTVSPHAGASTCIECPSPATSDQALSKCVCPVGAYAVTNDFNSTCSSELCTENGGGAVCDSVGLTTQTLRADDGWWRSDPESMAFMQCLVPNNCVNGGCAAHRTGALCAYCEPGYVSTSQLGSCSICPSHNSAIAQSIIFIILIAGAVVLIFRVVWTKAESDSHRFSDRIARGEAVVAAARVQVETKAEVEARRSTAADAGPDAAAAAARRSTIGQRTPWNTVHAFEAESRSQPNHTFKYMILVSFIQIASVIVGFAAIPWPTYFTAFIGVFYFLQFDFLPFSSLECTTSLNFYDKLVLVFAITMALVLVCGGVPYLCIRALNRLDMSDSIESRRVRVKQRQKVARLIIFGLFLLYPSVSSRMVSYFNCLEVNGTSYLVADFRLVCYGSEWKKYFGVAVAGVIIYTIGIPLAMLAMVYSNRLRLRHPDVLRTYGLIFAAYNTDYYYFEIVNMAEKVLLCSVLTFVNTGSKMPTGMLISGVMILILLLAQPYLRRVDNYLALTAQSYLFLLFLLPYVLQSIRFVVGSVEDVVASVILLACLFVLILLVIWYSVTAIRRYVRSIQRRAVLQEAKRDFVPARYLDARFSLNGSGGSSGASGGGSAGKDQAKYNSDSGTLESPLSSPTHRGSQPRMVRQGSADSLGSGSPPASPGLYGSDGGDAGRVSPVDGAILVPAGRSTGKFNYHNQQSHRNAGFGSYQPNQSPAAGPLLGPNTPSSRTTAPGTSQQHKPTISAVPELALGPSASNSSSNPSMLMSGASGSSAYDSVGSGDGGATGNSTHRASDTVTSDGLSQPPFGMGTRNVSSATLSGAVNSGQASEANSPRGGRTSVELHGMEGDTASISSSGAAAIVPAPPPPASSDAVPLSRFPPSIQNKILAERASASAAAAAPPPPPPPPPRE